MCQDSAIFFFLNQQFITRGARADRGSCFVTTYIQTGTTWKRKDNSFFTLTSPILGSNMKKLTSARVALVYFVEFDGKTQNSNTAAAEALMVDSSRVAQSDNLFAKPFALSHGKWAQSL